MPNLHEASTCAAGCDLSWTAGMPVHPEPAAPEPASGLRRKDLREMIVLASVCVISTIVFVRPLAGPASEPALSARDLIVNASLAPAVLGVPLETRARTRETVALPGTLKRSPSYAPARVHRASFSARQNASARVAAVRAVERRPVGAKVARVLVGDGRYRVRPFPRPSEFEY